MQSVFEKIIEKLDKERSIFKTVEWNVAMNKAIEIVKQAEAEYNNGWIPCSERLPEERDWYLAVFEEVDTGFIGIPYIADYLMGSHTKFTTEDGWIVRNCSDREDESAEYYKNLRCVAWQPLPEPYHPNNGHYGCNSNGEHERCDYLSCGIYDNCPNKNKIWFEEKQEVPEWKEKMMSKLMRGE